MKKCLMMCALLALTGSATAQIAISEVLEANSSLKYVELHNLTNAPIDLDDPNEDWTLIRTANANVSGDTIDLMGTIPANGFFVIANNATNFNTDTFGFDADQYNTTISHNGDDEYQLFVEVNPVSASGNLQGGIVTLVDSFAGDRIGNTTDFAANVVAFRLMNVFPNNGNWDENPPMRGQGLGTVSPSGFWITLPTTSSAEALANGTPGAKGGNGGDELPVELMNFSVE